MGLHRYIIHFDTGSGFEQATALIKRNGGELLPSPRIIPPVLYARVTEELAILLEKSQDVNRVDDLGDPDDE
ncbi:hypothetical protein BGZ46_008282 [Entomortierella lignicola]|nr:hypothetical protein BGZ46_008282 [Entomortierella lignicola]